MIDDGYSRPRGRKDRPNDGRHDDGDDESVDGQLAAWLGGTHLPTIATGRLERWQRS